jgi:Histidine kinase-, DNA gyrase B-, and HSP90-like ATPase
VAELVENAVHFSPPEASVVIRTRPFLQTPGAHVLTVEDWGVGMRPRDMDAANDLLATPHEVDLSVSQRLGLHVVARLAKRHGIEVSLTPTPGCGVTAAVVLPPTLFADAEPGADELIGDDAEITAEVVPIALPATVAAAPASGAPAARSGPPMAPSGAPAAPAAHSGRAPTGPSAPAASPGPAPAERWVDLTDAPARSAGNGNGDGHPATSDGDGADWSGWWEPSVGDLDHGAPLSPLAARPPLSERVQPPLSERVQPPSDRAQPPPPPPSSPGAPEPHPPASAPPEGERSHRRDWVPPAVHSPRAHSPHPASGAPHPDPGAPHPAPGSPQPAPVTVGEAAADGIVLARRVPQAHLAPELRRPGRDAPAPDPEGPLPDAAEARAALSRYQASRQAARAVVDQGGAATGGRADDVGPDGPAASDGGWS